MQAGMSDVLWNGRDIRDPWLSFELSWSAAGCHNDKGKVISWGIGRPLDKFLFPLAKEISLFISSTSSNDSEYCAPLRRRCFFIIDRNDSQLLFPVWCWLPGSERQAGLSMATIKPSWTVSAFIAAYGKDIGKGRVSKEIRLCDRGSFWMLIGSWLWVWCIICYASESKVVDIRLC